jgi:metal-dependent amidase/aminoacylase/carboxypeptidase family protein
MEKEALKKKVLDAIEARADDIIEVGDWIWSNPEVGYKEYKTAEYTARKFRELGLEPEEGIGPKRTLRPAPYTPVATTLRWPI